MTTFADNVNVSKLQMERAKVMLDVGSIAKSDYASLASQYSNDRYSYIAAKNSMQQDLLQLKQLLELFGDINIGVVSPEYSESDVFAALPDKKIAFEKALENRPEIKIGKMYIDRANQSVEIAKAGYLPNISLSAGTGISHNLPNEMNFGEQVYRRWSNSIGVNLSIPILDNKQNKTNVENAKINVESQKLDLVDKVKTLYMTIETLWLNAKNSQEQYFAASEQLNAVQTSFELVSEQFNLGMKNTTDLLSEKNKLISAQQDLIVAKYKAMYNSNVVTYEVVINAPNPDLKLKPGMTANVTFFIVDKQNVLCVSNKALKFSPRPPFVSPEDIINDCDAKDKLWIREANTFTAKAVNVGSTNGTITEVSGIPEGTVVVEEASFDSDANPVPFEMPQRNGSSSPFMPGPPPGKR